MNQEKKSLWLFFSCYQIEPDNKGLKTLFPGYCNSCKMWKKVIWLAM